jgi:hypothetical protein
LKIVLRKNPKLKLKSGGGTFAIVASRFCLETRSA